MTTILKQALPSQTQTVKQDAFDKATFETLRDSAEELKKNETQGQEVLKTWSPLMQDVFASLYKYTPEVRQEQEIKSSHRFNHSLINKAMGTDQWGQLRGFTRLDELNSAMATIQIANSLMETVKTQLKEEAELANQCASAEDGAGSADATADSLQDIANRAQGQQKQQYQTQANQARAKADKAAQAADKARAKLEQSLPGAQQKIRQAMRVAEQRAINQVKETSEMLESWSSEPGQLSQLPVEKRLELAEKLSASKKLKKLAKIIGRFRRLAIYGQKTKINHSQDEIYNVGMGNDLNRIVPSELGLLTNPITKREFFRKYTEGKLLMYELRGNEKTGKGPIVCCVDSSGSMSGDKEVWSKAVALGLLEISQMQKRAYACIFFGSANDKLETVIIEKGEKNVIEKVIHIAEYFLGGGTDFHTPLDKALEIIESSEFRKADIVFITDGEAGIEESWLASFLEKKKQMEVRITSILCDYGSSSNSSTAKFSDRVQATSDLTDELATDIFGGV